MNVRKHVDKHFEIDVCEFSFQNRTLKSKPTDLIIDYCSTMLTECDTYELFKNGTMIR